MPRVPNQATCDLIIKIENACISKKHQNGFICIPCSNLITYLWDKNGGETYYV